jgi:hypothetical protein
MEMAWETPSSSIEIEMEWYGPQPCGWGGGRVLVYTRVPSSMRNKFTYWNLNILEFCTDFGQFQPQIWCTLDHKTTQICWLAKMERHTFEVVVVVLLCCCVVAFALVIWCFYPHKCTSFVNFGQVVCPNILKCYIVDTTSPMLGFGHA